MKKFKNKKKKFNFKIIFYGLMFLLSFNATMKLCLGDKREDKEYLLSMLLGDMLKNENIIISSLSAKLSEPKEMIYSSLNKIVNKDNLSVFSNIEDDDFNYEEEKTNYIEDPNPINVDKPIVYIYNSHQTEEYSSSNPLDYSVKPNVMIASYVMKEYMNNNGIPAIVETANIKDFLKNNGLKYNKSYVASKYYIEQALNKYDSIEYLIDLHRDSATIDKTLYEQDGKSYARILFVVGMEHDGYESNLNLATTLNERIKAKYPGISRGISKKSGSNVNGIYNQDMSENAMLIEIGGVDNEIEEVYNTINAISEIIVEYIKEQNNG